MPWTPPQAPVTNTVIAVSWAVANVINPLNWLRLMAGNADPPGGGYVVASTSPSTTQWQRVNESLIDDHSISGDAKLRQDSVTGNSSTSAIPVNGVHSNRIMAGIEINEFNRIFNDDCISGDAKIIPSTITGNSGVSSIGVGAIHPNRLDRTGVSDGSLPIARTGSVNWDKVRSDGLATENGPTSGLMLGWNNATLALTWKRTNYDSFDSTNAPTAGSFLGFNPGAGRMEWGVPPGTAGGTPIPSGLVALVRSVAEIPSGWARETPLDGLLPVGGGASADGLTFNQGVQYGSTWNHQHTSNSFGVGAGTGNITLNGSISGGATAPSTRGDLSTISPGQATAYTPGGSGAFGVSGTCSISTNISVSGTASGNTTATQWFPPMRAYIYVRKS